MYVYIKMYIYILEGLWLVVRLGFSYKTLQDVDGNRLLHREVEGQRSEEGKTIFIRLVKELRLIDSEEKTS